MGFDILQTNARARYCRQLEAAITAAFDLDDAVVAAEHDVSAAIARLAAAESARELARVVVRDLIDSGERLV